MSTGATRRAALAGGAAIGLPKAVGAALPFAFEDAAIALAGSGAFPEFVAAAARAMLEREFDTARVTDLIAAVAAWQRGAAIPATLEPLAQRLLVILYTGETASSDPRASVGHYAWALAWHVLRTAKTPGLCSGGFGDWTRT